MLASRATTNWSSNGGDKFGSLPIHTSDKEGLYMIDVCLEKRVDQLSEYQLAILMLFFRYIRSYCPNAVMKIERGTYDEVEEDYRDVVFFKHLDK